MAWASVLLSFTLPDASSSGSSGLTPAFSMAGLVHARGVAVAELLHHRDRRPGLAPPSPARRGGTPRCSSGALGDAPRRAVGGDDGVLHEAAARGLEEVLARVRRRIDPARVDAGLGQRERRGRRRRGRCWRRGRRPAAPHRAWRLRRPRGPRAGRGQEGGGGWRCAAWAGKLVPAGPGSYRDCAGRGRYCREQSAASGVGSPHIAMRQGRH